VVYVTIDEDIAPEVVDVALVEEVQNSNLARHNFSVGEGVQMKMAH